MTTRHTFTNDTLRGHYAGRPAIVVGRGPSRHDVDESARAWFQSAGGVVWIVNKLVMLPEYTDADCLAFLDHNMLHGDKRPPFDTLPDYVKAFQGHVFCPSKWVFNAVRTGPVSRMDMSHRLRGFNPFGELFFNRGSVLFAFQLAALAGCNPIWVFGSDHRLCADGATHADAIGDYTKGPERWQRVMDRQLQDWLPVPAWCAERGIAAYKTGDFSRLPLPVKALDLAREEVAAG